MGFGVQSLGVWVHKSGLWVKVLGLRVQGLEFRGWASGSRVIRLEFRVHNPWFRVQNLACGI